METTISLSKALKVKNRLAGRLSSVNTQIATYNSVLVGRRSEVDVAELDRLRDNLVEALVTLKSSIMVANNGIYTKLNWLSEKKSLLANLQGLNTRHGVEPGYNGTSNEFVASIKKSDVDKRVKVLEREIDELQDSIDAYNADGKRLRIDTSVLELAS